MCWKSIFQSEDKFIKSGDLVTEKKHSIASIALNKEVIIIINLLSNLSDKYPIGHWNSAPAIVIKNKYKEISNTEKFIKAPYTDPNVKITGWINPVHNILKVASGEILYNSLILIEVVFLKVGGFLFVSNIGIKAIDKSKDTKINGSHFFGSSKFSSKVPNPIPTKVIII